MKTILLVMCVLMSIHAAISERPVFYDNAEACLKEILSNKISFNFKFLKHLNKLFEALREAFSSDHNIPTNIPKNISNSTLADAFICALKKDGLITQDGALSKSREEQYCEVVLKKPQNIKECQEIIKHCTDLECTQNSTVCTPEEVKKDMVCNVANGIASVLEYPLQIPGGSII